MHIYKFKPAADLPPTVVTDAYTDEPCGIAMSSYGIRLEFHAQDGFILHQPNPYSPIQKEQSSTMEVGYSTRLMEPEEASRFLNSIDRFLHENPNAEMQQLLLRAEKDFLLIYS